MSACLSLCLEVPQLTRLGKTEKTREVTAEEPAPKTKQPWVQMPASQVSALARADLQGALEQPASIHSVGKGTGQ